MCCVYVYTFQSTEWPLSSILAAVSPGSVSTDIAQQRGCFRQQKQELNSDVLERTTDFVKTYLAHADV